MNRVPAFPLERKWADAILLGSDWVVHLPGTRWKCITSLPVRRPARCREHGTYGGQGKAVRRGSADGFAVRAGDQYKISKIKLVASMIAVTPAMESIKASLASWWPTTLSVLIAKVRLRGCRDPDAVADGRMRFEIMGKALFNKKPRSRSTWRQTLRPSLIRRFGLRGDLTKFACLRLPVMED